jgi:hypothetical protein
MFAATARMPPLAAILGGPSLGPRRLGGSRAGAPRSPISRHGVMRAVSKLATSRSLASLARETCFAVVALLSSGRPDAARFVPLREPLRASSVISQRCSALL